MQLRNLGKFRTNIIDFRLIFLSNSYIPKNPKSHQQITTNNNNNKQMHISKQPGLDIKTLCSQCSNIDVFSKLQSNFLQKFFKYNLTDYFHQYFTNLYENVLNKNITGHSNNNKLESNSVAMKIEKYLASSLFYVQNQITVEEMEVCVNRFYRERSVSVAKNQLPFAFKLKYSNNRAAPNCLKPGELILIDIKIKAQIQTIEQLPQKILQQLQPYRLQKKSTQSPLQHLLSNYKHETFTILIIYFGDINFQIFNKKHYTEKPIKIMGRFYKLRLYVFYVSKQALLETFKYVNKIQNMEYINDLVIQFYQLKREKHRRKVLAKSGRGKAGQREEEGDDKHNKNEMDKVYERVYMFVGVFGLVGFGLAIKKLFL